MPQLNHWRTVIDPHFAAYIVADPNLTPDAVRLALYVASLGEGEHEIPANKLQSLLRCRGNKPVYAARAILADEGILDWRAGGNSHSTRYRLVVSQGDQSADRSPPRATNPAPIEDEGDDAITPVVPLLVVSAETDAAIEQHAERLAGCRGALRDYLRKRVHPDRQTSYVHDVAGKLGGLGFTWRNQDGRPVPKDEWPGLFAAALNELAATDEETEYRYPPGDPRNVRTKLGILVGQWGREPRKQQQATGTDGRPPPARRGKTVFDDADYGEGTTQKPGWRT